MPSHAEENRLRAERQFKAREQQKAGAWENYQAAQRKLRDRTRELREQRLAREAITKAQQ
jgi:hypothetical protein